MTFLVIVHHKSYHFTSTALSWLKWLQKCTPSQGKGVSSALLDGWTVRATLRETLGIESVGSHFWKMLSAAPGHTSMPTQSKPLFPPAVISLPLFVPCLFNCQPTGDALKMGILGGALFLTSSGFVGGPVFSRDSCYHPTQISR